MAKKEMSKQEQEIAWDIWKAAYAAAFAQIVLSQNIPSIKEDMEKHNSMMLATAKRAEMIASKAMTRCTMVPWYSDHHYGKVEREESEEN